LLKEGDRSSPSETLHRVCLKEVRLLQQINMKITLDIAGEKYKAEADVFSEALKVIYKDSFGMVKTWGDFILEKDGKKSRLRYRPIQIKRAFLGRFANDLLEKRLTMLLK